MLTNAATAYESHAQEFLSERDASMIGTQVVAQWCRALPKHAEVIELACGGGYPITRVLHDAGLKLWAVDSSPTLVAAFQRRFPDVPVQCATVQTSDFFSRTYHAAIAVGLLFLLSEDDQLALIQRVSKILARGGRFLFTAPLETHRWTDLSTGIGCHSLGQARYEACLAANCFRVVATFIDKGENNYYDVEKIG